MTIGNLFKIVKSKKITPSTFLAYIDSNNIHLESIKNYNNSWGENLLTYSIKHNYNIPLLDCLYDLGIPLSNNEYDMTPIDLCVAYNKNTIHQKFTILDWLYNKNIQFNPFYLLIYRRPIIEWIRGREWDIDVNERNITLGNTPLHEVCKIFHPSQPKTIYKKNKTNSYDAFYVLMEMGANPHITNNYGVSTIDYCLKNSLINNLNIIYHFGFELCEENINTMMESTSYYRLIKHTLWLLENYGQYKCSKTKEEMEMCMLSKIITIQLNITNHSNKMKELLNKLNDKIIFDKYYKLKMFDMENNMYIS